jgi:hypothetical protein
MMTVPMPQAANVLGLVAADLAIGELVLGAIGAVGLLCTLLFPRSSLQVRCAAVISPVFIVSPLAVC